MSLPLPQSARLRVLLCEEGTRAGLCGLARAGRGRTALEWTAEALAHGEDAGANQVVRQAPLLPGVHVVGGREQGDLPGFLADSLPDSWGRLLVDRLLRTRGVVPASLTGLDRLAIVGDRGPGALIYEPEVSLTKPLDAAVDLDSLAADAEIVLTGREPELLDRLVQAGGSAGGSRPKAWIAEDEAGGLRSGAGPMRDGETGWLVKFRAPDHDPVDVGPLELAYARMASAAGLDVAEPRLFQGRQGRHFGSRRFDRDGPRRIHVLTAAALLDVAPEQALSADYADLLKLTRHLTRSEEEAVEAYRQAVFNVLAHNRDDHLKQFAFRRKGGVWRRTPAYDLLYNEGPGGEHTLLVAGEGRRPGPEHLARLAVMAGIKAAAARDVVEQVRDAVARFEDFAGVAGVSAATTDAVAGRLGIGGTRPA